ncbi:protein of unknown function [Methanoculleus bourgensis]|uniref:DUF1743 domain-containing protein n=1 Tax=Methanoculleus bourgensis TaxID=83986 RepID=A0A0X3BN99_9EURY|nr:protein of unknown function [Methanoculleus bourgensis]
MPAPGVPCGLSTATGPCSGERAFIGRRDVTVGLDPAPAVGIAGVFHEDGYIHQHIRCIGGPAYSLTDMLSLAEGVCGVTVHREGAVVEGEVITQALAYVAIGIDDTDTRTEGATFALALALLQHLANLEGVMPIGHRVAMLNPRLENPTAGNSCSYIELAVEPGQVPRVEEAAVRFVADEAASPEWGVAVRQGFRGTAGPPGLTAGAHGSRWSRGMRRTRPPSGSGPVSTVGGAPSGRSRPLRLWGSRMTCCSTRSGMSASGGSRRDDILHYPVSPCIRQHPTPSATPINTRRVRETSHLGEVR